MTKNPTTATDRVLKLAHQAGMLRVRDLVSRGLHPENLRRLCKRGLLTRVRRGLYVLAGTPATENRTLAEVCKRVPGGVVCLLAALQFHGLTTHLPFEVWLAVDYAADRRTRQLKEPLPLRCCCAFPGQHSLPVLRNILSREYR